MKDLLQGPEGGPMNFLHLKYFLLVAEELNITRAAERLYISQQSLSNHISNMEKELNVKLFTRSPKLSLTYAGDLLVETATQILDLHSQFLAKVGDINRHYMGVLRLGISHTCGLALLPDILPQFQAEFPMVEFSLFEGNSTHLEDELAHGRVDLIVCGPPDGGAPDAGGAQGLHGAALWGPGPGGAGAVCLRGGHRLLSAHALHPHQAGQPHPGHGGPVLQPPLFQAQADSGDGEHHHHSGYGGGGGGELTQDALGVMDAALPAGAAGP